MPLHLGMTCLDHLDLQRVIVELIVHQDHQGMDSDLLQHERCLAMQVRRASAAGVPSLLHLVWLPDGWL